LPSLIICCENKNIKKQIKRIKKMAKTVDEYLKDCDWDLAIALINKKENDNKEEGEKNKEKLNAQDYFNRAYALYFKDTKEHKEKNYKDVIDDCSNAIMTTNLTTDNKAFKAFKLRAYAYYISGNYISAINDCKQIIEKPEPKSPCDIDTYELLGDIYTAIGNHEQATANYKEALVLSNMRPFIMKKYSDACNKLNKTKL
jgi:tetratricopeptide (TPR) repeat protein